MKATLFALRLNELLGGVRRKHLGFQIYDCEFSILSDHYVSSFTTLSTIFFYIFTIIENPAIYQIIRRIFTLFTHALKNYITYQRERMSFSTKFFYLFWRDTGKSTHSNDNITTIIFRLAMPCKKTSTYIVPNFTFNLFGLHTFCWKVPIAFFLHASGSKKHNQKQQY